MASGAKCVIGPTAFSLHEQQALFVFQKKWKLALLSAFESASSKEEAVSWARALNFEMHNLAWDDCGFKISDFFPSTQGSKRLQHGALASRTELGDSDPSLVSGIVPLEAQHA